MFKKTFAALAICGVMASPASASLFVIDNGVDFGSNGSTRTSPIRELGYTGTLATSIYLGDPSVSGTRVVDTNIRNVMDAYGFSAGVHTTLTGGTQEYFYPSNPDNLNINGLNNVPSVVDKNGFSDGETFPYGTLGTWGLTYGYALEGFSTGSNVQYDGGFFNVFYEDGGVAKQVLRLNVTSSDMQLTNLNLFGFITFDFNGDGLDDAANDPFIQNMFVDVVSGKSFYDLWLADPRANTVKWVLDTNVNPPLPTADQLYQTDTGALVRQTTLDGSLRFAVPEPASIALFSVALLGLGFSRKNRKLDS